MPCLRVVMIVTVRIRVIAVPEGGAMVVKTLTGDVGSKGWNSYFLDHARMKAGTTSALRQFPVGWKA